MPTLRLSLCAKLLGIQRHAILDQEPMRKVLAQRVEDGRLLRGPWRSVPADGANGAFEVQLKSGRRVNVIASDGTDWEESGLPLPVWEHVSVSLPDRCPTWQEMDEVKGLFFEQNEIVLQFHINTSRKVDIHRYTLHLWRPLGVDLPLPPRECV